MVTESPDRRDELLDLVTDYVLKHGIATLSLRPLAAAVGSSPRVLLYYYGSKEGLISEVIDRLRDRQRIAFADLPRNALTFSDTVRAVWSVLGDPKNESIFRLFIEIYGLALQDRKRYGRFLRAAVDEWLDFMEQPWMRAGASKPQARAFATVLLAGFRGFLLDLHATHDYKRLESAIAIWIAALDAMPEPWTA